MGIFGHYLSDSDLRNIEEYKYSSGSYTALDNFLSKNLWEPCVKLFPHWVAPNLMTLLGFMASVVAFLIVIGCAPTLSEPIPPWACGALAICVFLYQTLDALDGKQARRTKSSTPLGTLFDHGCDIVTSTLLALCSVGLMQCGVSLTSFCAFTFSCQVMQFLYLWWEYYFHVFCSNPGYGTGVTEAQCVLMCLALIGAIFGTEVFTSDLLVISPKFFGVIALKWGVTQITVSDAIMWIILVNNILCTLYCLLVGLFRVKGIKTKVLGLMQFSSFFVFVGLNWLFYDNVIRFLESYSVIGYFGMIFTYSTLCVRLLLAATSMRTYSLLQWPLVPFASTTALIYFKRPMSVALLQLLACILCVIQGAIFADLMLTAIHDLCNHLKIKCFSISRQHIQ